MSDFGGRRYDIPEVPANVRRMTGTVIILLILAISGVVILSTATVRIPSGNRGVLLTWGKVEDRILQEGLSFKIPFSQTVVLMNTQIQKAESTEATATADLQEVSTTVAVNYRLDTERVNQIYVDLRQDYVNRVIKPNIEESIKATTAEYRAEELVTNRADVKATLDEILTERLALFNIDVVSVSLTDFQFSSSFSAAIDAKVTAEQQALVSKNELEKIRYEAQQQIIQAEAAKNATIARAQGDAFAVIIEANATAQAIEIITQQMTTEYANYLWLQQWDGRLPAVMTKDEQGLIIDASDFITP
ncbi:prohibitin family protein [Candidatus Bathyarchaeota archaeon]|jgi:prohibitin 2|nr:prohibitin family protein [Candidatus Bathyarchaeota archaeon]MBT4424171.1 prohibitin family protein [Candidatus Bathyarchaeota archaeon]MBT5643220.1 prohibitin family protein [Candidatus Bathyarchaeota archaeon]MBT7187556.1 prohibitin family protein [Candidatus Bathyarchaeota archaeon]MBT7346094.1 prohibitin family protein [Candidatus Bathyarchaeota archaeon]